MRSQKYNIVMHTPIGGRHGMMEVTFDGSKLNGEIELLQQKVPFEGMVRENGECEISGRIRTLMKTINYTACGEITLRTLWLDLEGGHTKLKISGEPIDLPNKHTY